MKWKIINSFISTVKMKLTAQIKIEGSTIDKQFNKRPRVTHKQKCGETIIR